MANLPYVDQAIVEQAKITQYLLSTTHPQGASEARFFLGYGFGRERATEFRDAIVQHARSNEVSRTELTQFGRKYVVEGPIVTPDGRSPLVASIWFIATGETLPRLV